MTLINRFAASQLESDIPLITGEIESFAFTRRSGINTICLGRGEQIYAFKYTRDNLRQVMKKIREMSTENPNNPYFPDFDSDTVDYLELIIRNCNEI